MKFNYVKRYELGGTGITSARNGVKMEGGSVLLGGPLTEPTDIETSSFDLSVSNGAGYILKVSDSGSVDAINGYSVNGVRTFFADQSLQSYYVGETAGSGNTATRANLFGYSAGFNNTGVELIGIGSSAGALNSGNYNIAIGYGSGTFNTSGGNVMIGQNAGQSNAGADTVALGSFSTTFNTGNSVIAIGSGAGSGNTGSYNLFIGYTAGMNNTGNNVVGIGNLSAKNNTLSNIITFSDQFQNMYFNGVSQLEAQLQPFTIQNACVRSGGAEPADQDAVLSSFNLAVARGTGTGRAGDINFLYSPPIASGNTLQALVSGITFSGNTGRLGIKQLAPLSDFHLSGSLSEDSIVLKSVNYNVGLSDHIIYAQDNITLTLPPSVSAGVGKVYEIFVDPGKTATIAATGDTIFGSASVIVAGGVNGSFATLRLLSAGKWVIATK